jgi:hypothetical protein
MAILTFGERNLTTKYVPFDGASVISILNTSKAAELLKIGSGATASTFASVK